MWTPDTRAEHDRDDLRYPSDLTDAKWLILEPLLPPPAKTGRHQSWQMRELMNAICFVLRGGVAWRMLPEHFPPHQTTYRWFTRFRDDGTWENLNHRLVMLDRERVGREASPSAAVIGPQSVKTTEGQRSARAPALGPAQPDPWDGGKKIIGPQTPRVGGHRWPWPGGAGAPSLGSGSRRRPVGTEGVPRPLPFHPDGVCRQHLCRRAGRNRDVDHRTDRPQAARPGRLQGAAAPLGGRALLHLDQPQPTLRQGLRGHDHFGYRVPLCCLRHAVNQVFGSEKGGAAWICRWSIWACCPAGWTTASRTARRSGCWCWRATRRWSTSSVAWCARTVSRCTNPGCGTTTT